MPRLSIIFIDSPHVILNTPVKTAGLTKSPRIISPAFPVVFNEGGPKEKILKLL